MAQIGNKKNSQLNFVWATHVKKRNGDKRMTSKLRRIEEKEIIKEILDGKTRRERE